MQQEEKYIYMTETPVPRLIGELAVPTIISMLVTSFYNMVDTFLWGGSTGSLRRQWASFFR